MRIDIHTHAFHPKVAARAVAHLNSSYMVHCEGTGTLADLEEDEAAAGLDANVVLCAATSPSQVIPANNFALNVLGSDSRAIAFGTLHPAYGDWERELARLEQGGIHGLKLHPDFQGISMDDVRLRPIFEACQGRFCILFHVGSRSISPSAVPSSPWALMRVLRNFPRLDVIAGHFGGYQMWQYVPEVLGGYRGDHLWLDTSSTSMFVDGRTLRSLLSLRPFEQYFFGSDWPLYRPSEELERFQRLSGYGDGKMDDLVSHAALLLRAYGMLTNRQAPDRAEQTRVE
ncbi:MAG: amidohydrolase family protein [Desulfovibrionaceae bacterium]|nr:amidohydrolase family protein [Desulfovibrionaceae bacterium]